MLNKHLANPDNGQLFIFADPEDRDLVSLIEKRGFIGNPDWPANESEFDLLKQALLPPPTYRRGSGSNPWLTITTW